MTADVITAYFDAWQARDADAVLATLGADGTYEDPTTGGPIGGEAMRGYLAALWGAFPDLNFEIVSKASTGPDTVAAQWIMRGVNTGSMRGLPPTGNCVEVHGADFFTLNGDHIKTVTGYFDSGAVPRQLGLDVIVQPSSIGPFRFGTSVTVSTGKREQPGAFSVTYLEARDAEAVEKVREGSRASLIDMLPMEGFIGATTSTIGTRMVTITAWTDAEAPRKVMAQGAHSEAMRGMYSGELAEAGYTSVWSLERDNGFLVRCPNCGAMARKVSDGDVCQCGETLPLHPPYW